MTEQAIKVTETIADSLIRKVVTIDESQFGFVSGRGTTDTIFVIRQLQEKYLTVSKQIYKYGFRGPRECVRPSSSERDLVDNEKAWC